MPVLQRSVAAALLKQKQQQHSEATDENPSPSDEVFVVASSGEIYRTYEEYLERVTLYHQHVWTCRLSGQTGMTYYEAQESEQRAHQSLEDFPEWWKPYVLTMTHCSTEALDVLATRIATWCKGHLALNEPVNLPFNGQWLRGMVSGTPPFREEESETGDYSGYRISINDGDLIMTGACQSPEDVRYKKLSLIVAFNNELLRRQFSPPNKSLLKRYIRSVAVRYGHAGMPWLLHDGLVQKYDIRKQLSPELEMRIRQLKVLREEREKSMRHRQLSALALESPNTKSIAPAPTIAAVAEEIKYPILDEFIPPERQIDPTLWPCPKRPGPTVSVALRMTDVLEIWTFIHAFGENLEVSPMSLGHFISSLEYSRDPNPIFEAIVMGFMHQFNRTMRTARTWEERVEEFLQNDYENCMFIYNNPTNNHEDKRSGESGMDETKMEKFVKDELRPSKKTWDLRALEFLWNVRVIPEARQIIEQVAGNKGQRVGMLSGCQKLDLLLLLRNFYLTAVSLRSYVDREVEAGAELKQQIREADIELRRLSKQEQELLVQQNSLGEEVALEDKHSMPELKRIRRELRDVEGQLTKLQREQTKLSRKVENMGHKQNAHNAVRMRMLGEDRFLRRYWWLDLHLTSFQGESNNGGVGSGILLVEMPDNYDDNNNNGSSNNGTWGWYDEEEEIDKLLYYLNPLGFREGHLGSTLSELADDIISSLRSFPHSENGSLMVSERKDDSSEEDGLPVVEVRRRRDPFPKRSKMLNLPAFLRYRNIRTATSQSK